MAAPPGTGYEPFNRQAEAGLAECGRQTGAEITAADPPPDADYERGVVLYATEDYDAVVGVGYAMAPGVARAARRFELTHFVLIDAVANQPNVESITFAEQEGAFLAGALAGMTSRTGSVAFIGGNDSALLEKSEAGFRAGVREVDPRAAVRVAYVGSFADRSAAERLAKRVFDAGSDVAYVVAGSSGLGVIDEAKARRGAFVIGADSDQDALAPGTVLTSVVKRVDQAALRACLETTALKPASGHRVLGVADGGIEITGFRYSRGVVGEATIARLARIRQAIVDGRIVPPSTRSGLTAFEPVPVP